MTIDFKTQTPRSTKFHTKVTNINLFCNNFEIGIRTSNGWGDFEEGKEPIIEMTINQEQYKIPLSKFKIIAKRNFEEYKL